jgi:hypothetical protein
LMGQAFLVTSALHKFSSFEQYLFFCLKKIECLFYFIGCSSCNSVKVHLSILEKWWKEEKGKREHQGFAIRGGRLSRRGRERSPLLRRRSADVAGRSTFPRRAMTAFPPTSGVVAGANGVLWWRSAVGDVGGQSRLLRRGRVVQVLRCCEQAY